jgi:ATP-dependent 26S proteasome regulatory subunit
MNHPRIFFEGIPGVPESERALFHVRTAPAVQEFAEKTGVSDLEVVLRRQSGRSMNGVATELPRDRNENLLAGFESRQPEFSFKRLCLPENILDLMLSAIATIQYEAKIFDEWGLREIQAFARTAILLNGPPGTGKTAAAHALADHLGLPILCATTADLESKFLGDGPKLVQAFFAAAREQNALAFLDEADTPLGSRMNVTQGSERAANSMTSQLLIELERHQGIVVFATNLLYNVDQAFTTRVLKINIPLPDRDMRKKLWQHHLPPKLPLRDIDIDALSDIDGVCGRDIRNAVVLAASTAARSSRTIVSGHDLIQAIGSGTKNSTATSRSPQQPGTPKNDRL